MILRRTANAGVLLRLDGVTILLDGVCREVKPYPATPPWIKAELTENIPDAIAFTHSHKDHYDPGFAATVMQKNGVILGPEDCHGKDVPVMVGDVRITPISSRHIGISGRDVKHYSFLIEGSKRILFTGDAAPTQWQGKNLQKLDVLIVPYAYCITDSAWSATQRMGAETVVLVHMPKVDADSDHLWQAVKNTVGANVPGFYIPDIDNTIML